MRSAKNLAMAAILIMVLLLGNASAAILGDVLVDGETREFYADDFIDNLTVKNGGKALLWSASVYGEITVEGENSYLGLNWASVGGNVELKDQGRASIGWSTIGGSLEGLDFYHINFTDTDVLGSIELKGGGDFNGDFGWGSVIGGDFEYEEGHAVILKQFIVGGNVQVVDNDGGGSGFIEIMDCQISGDIEVLNNENMIPQWSWHRHTIENNTVGGNLEVKNNTPAPTVTGNTVDGEVEVD